MHTALQPLAEIGVQSGHLRAASGQQHGRRYFRADAELVAEQGQRRLKFLQPFVGRPQQRALRRGVAGRRRQTAPQFEILGAQLVDLQFLGDGARESQPADVEPARKQQALLPADRHLGPLLSDIRINGQFGGFFRLGAEGIE
jgi:hypothetical protein